MSKGKESSKNDVHVSKVATPNSALEMAVPKAKSSTITDSITSKLPSPRTIIKVLAVGALTVAGVAAIVQRMTAANEAEGREDGSNDVANNALSLLSQNALALLPNPQTALASLVGLMWNVGEGFLQPAPKNHAWPFVGAEAAISMPKDPDLILLIEQGLALYKAGEYKASEIILREAHAKDPDNDLIKNNLAITLSVQGIDHPDPKVRVRFLREAHALYPSHEKIKESLINTITAQAKAPYEKEDYKTAAGFFREASTIDPSNKSLRDSLIMTLTKEGTALYEKKNYEAAIPPLSEALDLDPNNDLLRENLANAFHAQSQALYEKNADSINSTRLCREAFRLNPSSEQFKRDLSSLIVAQALDLSNKGDYEAAEKLVIEALGLYPNHKPFEINLATIREKLGINPNEKRNAYYTNAGMVTAGVIGVFGVAHAAKNLWNTRKANLEERKLLKQKAEEEEKRKADELENAKASLKQKFEADLKLLEHLASSVQEPSLEDGVGETPSARSRLNGLITQKAQLEQKKQNFQTHLESLATADKLINLPSDLQSNADLRQYAENLYGQQQGRIASIGVGLTTKANNITTSLSVLKEEIAECTKRVEKEEKAQAATSAEVEQQIQKEVKRKEIEEAKRVEIEKLSKTLADKVIKDIFKAYDTKSETRGVRAKEKLKKPIDAFARFRISVVGRAREDMLAVITNFCSDKTLEEINTIASSNTFTDEIAKVKETVLEWKRPGDTRTIEINVNPNESGSLAYQTFNETLTTATTTTLASPAAASGADDVRIEGSGTIDRDNPDDKGTDDIDEAINLYTKPNVESKPTLTSGTAASADNDDETTKSQSSDKSDSDDIFQLPSSPTSTLPAKRKQDKPYTSAKLPTAQPATAAPRLQFDKTALTTMGRSIRSTEIPKPNLSYSLQNMKERFEVDSALQALKVQVPSGAASATPVAAAAAATASQKWVRSVGGGPRPTDEYFPGLHDTTSRSADDDMNASITPPTAIAIEDLRLINRDPVAHTMQNIVDLFQVFSCISGSDSNPAVNFLKSEAVVVALVDLALKNKMTDQNRDVILLVDQIAKEISSGNTPPINFSSDLEAKIPSPETLLRTSTYTIGVLKDSIKQNFTSSEISPSHLINTLRSEQTNLLAFALGQATDNETYREMFSDKEHITLFRDLRNKLTHEGKNYFELSSRAAPTRPNTLHNVVTEFLSNEFTKAAVIQNSGYARS